MQNFNPLASKLREAFEVTHTHTLTVSNFFPADLLTQTMVIFKTYKLASLECEISFGD